MNLTSPAGSKSRRKLRSNFRKLFSAPPDQGARSLKLAHKLALAHGNVLRAVYRRGLLPPENGRRRRGKPHHERVRTGTSHGGALVCNGIRKATPAGEAKKI